MSRYTIPGYDAHLEVTVGWDAPMATFFATVHDPSAVDDATYCLYWVGNTPGALPALMDLADAIKDYAQIPATICKQLLQDKRQPHTPSPLQQWALRLFAQDAP